jgi:hypothetical protein
MWSSAASVCGLNVASLSSLPERGGAGSTKTQSVPEENRQQRLGEGAEEVVGGRGLGGGERVLQLSAEAAGQTHAAAQAVLGWIKWFTGTKISNCRY